MRIHELAKKHNVKSEALLEILKKAGIEAKSHMSSVTDEMKTAVAAHFKPAVKKAKPTTTAKKAKAPKTVKAKAVPKAKVKPKTVKVQKAEAAPREKEAKAKPKAKAAAKPKRAAKAVEKKTTPKEKAKPPARASRKAPPKEAAPPRRPVKATVDRRTVTLPPAKKPRPPRRREVVDAEAQQKAVRESVRRTLAKLETTRRTKRRKGKPQEESVAVEKPVQIMDAMTVREVAEAFKLDANEILRRCLDLGLPASITQALEKEAIELLAEDLGKSVEFVSDEIESLLQPEAEIEPRRLRPRAPIVTVMGHVDHGKTSILDFIRKTSVASGEVGGITQHIGAYEIEVPEGKITFIDTPGHEAFTSMRARGAQVTDIVVLVVAADDGVMPQTLEAINHAKDAGVPIVVAINKIDLPAAKPAQIRQQLTEHGIVAEEFGGDVIVTDVSAKTGEGIDKLLEMLILQSDVLELKADRDASAQGVAIEVKKEEGRGILCTVLVTQGTLRVGDVFVVGQHYGKVRALLDHVGRTLKRALPSMPVLVLGCNGLPQAGDKLTVVRGEREARELSMRRQQAHKERERRTTKKLTLEELYSQIEQGGLKELRLIIRGDANGSVEALAENLSQLSAGEVGVKVIHSGVGVVNESDILLADSSDAIIIAFGVKVSPKAQELADREDVEIRTYDIIYECISEVDEALRGLLEPERVERVVGRAEVRQVFKISRLGLIAGSYVMEGSITRNAQIRVFRADEVVFEGKISSLKRFQDDVREVAKDFECGIGITGLNDLQEGDVIEAYVVEEKAKVI
ncbi:MAG: translation initiation factor IF-2 [Candidatus Latescibacterota bacterium]|nr:MAG: translation initiation factor IF-2 [Candidatus Latescibacterota bacterium]